MASLFQPTVEMLEKSAQDVVYERSMFCFAASRLREFFGNNDHRTGSLILEACLIHSRNLLEFFYGTRKSQNKDVLLSDYIAPEVWTPLSPEWLTPYKKKCNKLLAHLTFERLDYVQEKGTEWDVRPQVAHLEKQWLDFIRALQPERRAWFQSVPS